MSKIFNWSEISRLLTKGDRGGIRRSYKGKRYKEAVEEIKEFENNWINKWVKK